ncbi:MAG: hypothetical protein RMJ98_03095 [Myxococcales bacterium]|nr:hypothetical protein [Polyangiaceae bacterium]MDW8248276.1 hypothetical protein [Myxococcales bacterium]
MIGADVVAGRVRLAADVWEVVDARTAGIRELGTQGCTLIGVEILATGGLAAEGIAGNSTSVGVAAATAPPLVVTRRGYAPTQEC